MTPAISIAFLLLSATVFKSLEAQHEKEEEEKEEEDFAPQSELAARLRSQHYREEILQNGGFPGSCRACKFVVTKVKEKLGNDASKEKIRQLVNNACNHVKSRIIRSACKWLMRKIGRKLIDAIANKGTPESICARLKLCKKNKPTYESTCDASLSHNRLQQTTNV